MLSRIEMVNEARRPLLAYAALVLEHVVRIARPRDIVISALGVREGLLYSELPARERAKDGLICRRAGTQHAALALAASMARS